MTNIAQTFQTNNPDRLAIARAALTKARMPKKSVSVEDFTELEYFYHVEIFNKAGEWEEKVLSKAELHTFIENTYSRVFDTCIAGEHDQYEDTRTPAEYLQENQLEVITNFLNHKF